MTKMTMRELYQKIRIIMSSDYYPDRKCYHLEKLLEEFDLNGEEES